MYIQGFTHVPYTVSISPAPNTCYIYSQSGCSIMWHYVELSFIWTSTGQKKVSILVRCSGFKVCLLERCLISGVSLERGMHASHGLIPSCKKPFLGKNVVCLLERCLISGVSLEEGVSLQQTGRCRKWFMARQKLGKRQLRSVSMPHTTSYPHYSTCT